MNVEIDRVIIVSIAERGVLGSPRMTFDGRIQVFAVEGHRDIVTTSKCKLEGNLCFCN